MAAVMVPPVLTPFLQNLQRGKPIKTDR